MSCPEPLLIQPSSVVCVEKEDGNIETLSMASTVATAATSTAGTSTNSLSSSFSSYHSSSSNSNSIRKSVSFFPTVDVVFVRHISEYAATEVNELWTTNHERAANKAECTVTCQYMTKLGRNFLTQDEETNTGHCSRGLEYRTMDGFKQRRQRKANSRTAVLYQQQQLRSYDTYDLKSSILSAVYQKHSLPCHKAAHQAGLHDEQVARGIYGIADVYAACTTITASTKTCDEHQEHFPANINQHRRRSLGSTITPAAA